MDKSSLLRDNDEVAGKMKGLELLPDSVIPFKMERSFKPDLVDAQLVNCEGVVVRHGLSVVVDGKLGYINLPPDDLPEGSYTVRMVKPINGHPPDVLEVKSFCIATHNQPETKKRKVEDGLYPQLQGENLLAEYSNDSGDNPIPIPDLGDVAIGETPDGELDSNHPSPEEEERLNDAMEMIKDYENQMDERTLNTVVLESDGHGTHVTMQPPRVEEIKLWDTNTEDGPKLGYIKNRKYLIFKNTRYLWTLEFKVTRPNLILQENEHSLQRGNVQKGSFFPKVDGFPA